MLRNAIPPLLPLCALIAAGCGTLAAQPAPATPAPPRLVLLTTRFRTPLGPAALLERMAAYYDEQVGRKLPLALPELAPGRRYEVWHDMWVEFEPLGQATGVTLKRPTAPDSSRLAKGWMLELAGRLEAALPLDFQESVPLQTVEGDFWGSRRDAANALAGLPPMQVLSSWEHAGLLVSYAPLASIALAPAGAHGIHHVTVTAETAGAARQIWAALQRASSHPGLCAAWSEQAELESEVKTNARTQTATLAVSSSSAILIPQIDPGRTEQKLREDPEMHSRMLAAQGQYSVKYRLDQPYLKVSFTWLELTGFNRADGSFATERRLGESVLTSPKPLPASAAPLTLRTKLPPLAPGAYRIRMQGESATGSVRIDERTYWFDGKVFEEV